MGASRTASFAVTPTGTTEEKKKKVGPIMKDLSTRSSFFRQQLVEEFRISDQFEWNSKDAPVYTTRDLSLDPEVYHTLLRDTPSQLVKFKHFKRKKATAEFDKRLTRIKNIYHMPVGVWAAWLSNNTMFQGIYMFLVVLSAALVVLQSELDASKYYLVLDGLRIIDYLIVALFVMEILIKWMDSFRNFWHDGWNVFDLFVTVLALPDVVIYFLPFSIPQASLIFKFIDVVRLLRTLRALRMVGRFSFLRIIMQTILRATLNLLFIVILLFILMYIMAIFGINLFASYVSSTRTDLTYQFQFSSLFEGVVTMFQIITLDHWLALYLDVKKVVPEYIVLTYFMFWIWIGALIFRNIFVGIMVNHFQNIKRELQSQVDAQRKVRRLQKLQRQLKRKKMIKETKTDAAVDGEPIADAPMPGTGSDELSHLSTKDGPSSMSEDAFSMSMGSAAAHVRRPSDLSMASDSQIAGSDGERSEQIIKDPVVNTTGIELRNHLENLAVRTPETTWPRDTLYRYLRAMDNLMENQREFQELEMLSAMALNQLHDTAA